MIELTLDITQDLKSKGFSMVSGDAFLLTGNFQNFIQLTNSWEKMEKDIYYGNKGKATRYRRYSDFSYDPINDSINQLEHKSYFQSKQNNSYVGGKTRHFQDFGTELIDSPIIRSLVKEDFQVYAKTLPEEYKSKTWQCQIHQIRIEVSAGKEVEITPEKIHCDGYPFSAVHFWGKNNIAGAESKLYNNNESEILSAMFENILDTLFFFDREMLHYVTPASTKDNSIDGYRQIIAISFSLPGSDYDIVK